jgi:hypothetical protein
MATRTLESRFEHMSVNDENDPADGNKYQKTKVHQRHKLRVIAKKVIDNHIFNDIHFSIITNCKPVQSIEVCSAKSKYNQHNRVRTLAIFTMAVLKGGA